MAGISCLWPVSGGLIVRPEPGLRLSCSGFCSEFRLRVPPFDHGIEPVGPSLSQMPYSTIHGLEHFVL